MSGCDAKAEGAEKNTMQVPPKFRGASGEVLSKEAKDIGEEPGQGPVTGGENFEKRGT